MIHYGKSLDGDLQIIVNEEHIEALRQVILSASLEQRRIFYGLKHYIEENFQENI